MIHRLIITALLCTCWSESVWAQDSVRSPFTRRLQSVFSNSGEEKGPEPEAQPPFPIVIWVHESAFQINSNNQVDTVSPVDMVIVGTRAIGTSRTTGTIKVECVPEPDSSSILVSFVGQTNSKSVGQSGPASVHSRSSTTFKASRRISLSAEDGLKCQKTNLQSKTTLKITDIESSRGGLRGGLVRRLGWRRADRVHAQAEQEASVHARQHIMAAFDRALDERVGSINKELEMARFIYSLRRKPSELTVQARSCEGYLRFALVPKGTKDVADVDIPPPKCPLEVCVHQSELGDPGVPLPESITKLANVTAPLTANLSAIQTLLKPSTDDATFQIRSEDRWFIASFGRQATSSGPEKTDVARRTTN